MSARKRSSAALPHVAGAGTGTLLVLLAKNLSDANPYKSWLVICAPTASVVVGSFLLWVKTSISNYLDKRSLDSAIAEARATLETALNNAATTDAHKKKMRESLEKLEKLAVDAHMSRVQGLVE